MAAAAGSVAPPSGKPKLIVFDLDGCLWDPEMYELWGGGAPFRAAGDGSADLLDAAGVRVRMLGNIQMILSRLAEDDDVIVGVASSTDEPTWARECMEKFTLLNGRPISSAISYYAIHKGRKSSHFAELREATGLAFNEMLFYDNEIGNCKTVAALGVTAVHTPSGVTEAAYVRGLAEWPASGVVRT
jgi:magnesium-dependent phosphatase 1